MKLMALLILILGLFWANAHGQNSATGIEDVCKQLSTAGRLTPDIKVTCSTESGANSSFSPNGLLASSYCNFIFSCDYYEQCIGKLVDCSPPRKPNYFKNYGGKYCAKFKDSHDHPEISGYGEGTKLWTRCTMICLQRSLDKEYQCTDFIGNIPLKESPNDKCLRYYNKAFDGHPSCYTDSGLCLLLPPSQQVYIGMTVDPSDLITPESRRQIAQATQNCAFNYLDLYNSSGSHTALNSFQQKVYDVETAALNLEICTYTPSRPNCLVEEAIVRSFDKYCQSASRPTAGWDCSKDWNQGSNQFSP